MATRYVFAQEATFYHACGLKIPRNSLPSKLATEYFFSELIDDILITENPVRKHRCTSLCGQPIYIHLGFPNNENVRSACPDASKELVGEFEELISNCVFGGDEKVDIQALGMRILPCSKVLEIIDLAIYL